MIDFDPKLMKELVQLTRRHSSESLNSLAELLRDPVSAKDLAEILEFAASNTRSTASDSQKRKKAAIGSLPGERILSDLSGGDLRKHTLLAQFRSDYLRGVILKTLSDAREFVRRNSINVSASGSRDRTLVPLLRQLAGLPTNELENVVTPLYGEDTSDRSLEKWSRLILKK